MTEENGFGGAHQIAADSPDDGSTQCEQNAAVHQPLQHIEGASRDARHNLAVFEFAEQYAESEELAWSLKQFQPHVLMVLARARASQALEDGNYDMAISRVEEGLSRLRNFYHSHGKSDMDNP